MILKKDIGLNNLEIAIRGIKSILIDATPTLEFAKECIEECGGKEAMLRNLRNGLDAEKGQKKAKKGAKFLN